jgi:hypothetical protein
MFYGNSSIVSQHNPSSAVWDANYKGVWHLPTSLGLNDSTSNARNGTNHSVSATTGKIGGGGSFVRASSQYISMSDTGLPSGNSSISISAWIKTTYDAGGGEQDIFAYGSGAVLQLMALGVQTGNNLSMGYYTGGGKGTVVVNDGNWHYVTGTFTGGTTRLYVDGNPDGVFGPDTLNTTLTGTAVIGQVNLNSQFWNGSLDEVRVSSIARTANWIKTEYNNQNAPASFYSIGAEQ